jgi:hypothetical protein
LTPASQQIEMKRLEKADNPSIQQLKSSKTISKVERTSEHTKGEYESEISWEDFNFDWWRSLTTEESMQTK